MTTRIHTTILTSTIISSIINVIATITATTTIIITITTTTTPTNTAAIPYLLIYMLPTPLYADELVWSEDVIDIDGNLRSAGFGEYTCRYVTVLASVLANSCCNVCIKNEGVYSGMLY